MKISDDIANNKKNQFLVEQNFSSSDQLLNFYGKSIEFFFEEDL